MVKKKKERTKYSQSKKIVYGAINHDKNEKEQKNKDMVNIQWWYTCREFKGSLS